MNREQFCECNFTVKRSNPPRRCKSRQTCTPQLLLCLKTSEGCTLTAYLQIRRDAIDDLFGDAENLWLYVTLIHRAAIQPKTVVRRSGNGTVKVNLTRGQALAGRRHLAKALGWNPAKVQRRLGHLAKAGLISTQSGTCTIANFDCVGQAWVKLACSSFERLQDWPELLQLHCHLIRTAAIRTTTTVDGFHLKRGQLLTGRHRLAKALGDDAGTVRHRLDKLCSLGLISVIPSLDRSTVEVIDFDCREQPRDRKVITQHQGSSPQNTGKMKTDDEKRPGQGKSDHATDHATGKKAITQHQGSSPENTGKMKTDDKKRPGDRSPNDSKKATSLSIGSYITLNGQTPSESEGDRPKISDEGRLSPKFAAAVQPAVEIVQRLSGHKADLRDNNTRKLIAVAATLSVTKLSEAWLQDCLAGVTECRPSRPVAYFLKLCRDRAEAKHTADFDELADAVKVPRTFYEVVREQLKAEAEQRSQRPRASMQQPPDATKSAKADDLINDLALIELREAR